MYKTVSFNIFEEGLEEIIYRDNSAKEKEKNIISEKNDKPVTQRITEILIKPIIDRGHERKAS